MKVHIHLSTSSKMNILFNGFRVLLNCIWIAVINKNSMAQTTDKPLRCSGDLPKDILQVCETAPKAVEFHHCRIIDEECRVNRTTENNMEDIYLEMAPCPPSWNLALLCTTNEKLTCSDRAHIFERCTGKFKYPNDPEDVCNARSECKDCSQILGTTFFKNTSATICFTTEPQITTVQYSITAFSTTTKKHITGSDNPKKESNHVKTETGSPKTESDNPKTESSYPKTTTGSPTTDSIVPQTEETYNANTIAISVAVPYWLIVTAIICLIDRKMRRKRLKNIYRIQKQMSNASTTPLMAKYRDNDPDDETPDLQEVTAERQMSIDSTTSTLCVRNYPDAETLYLQEVTVNKSKTKASTLSTTSSLADVRDKDPDAEQPDMQKVAVHKQMSIDSKASTTPLMDKNQKNNLDSETPVMDEINTNNLDTETPLIDKIDSNNLDTETPLIDKIQRHNLDTETHDVQEETVLKQMSIDSAASAASLIPKTHDNDSGFASPSSNEANDDQ